ncbi:unnamed protein product, partial [Rotaria sordida]
PNLIQQYSTLPMENLLKQKDNSEQFLVIKNDQKHVPSPNWSTFGFPAKHVEDGSYQRIISFANCFKCKDTYSYQSRRSSSSSLSSENNREGPMDKFIISKKSTSLKLAAQRIKNNFTKNY